MPGQIGAAAVMLTLLAASRMDLRSMSVKRLVWVPGGGVVGILTIMRLCGAMQEGETACRVVSFLSLLAFLLLQQCLFARMYGRADCHAFCLCAACFWGMGYGCEVWVYQMALAYVLLAVTQALRRNIARTGNLKQPVPFLPYITGSFALWVDFIFWE